MREKILIPRVGDIAISNHSLEKGFCKLGEKFRVIYVARDKRSFTLRDKRNDNRPLSCMVENCAYQDGKNWTFKRASLFQKVLSKLIKNLQKYEIR